MTTSTNKDNFQWFRVVLVVGNGLAFLIALGTICGICQQSPLAKRLDFIMCVIRLGVLKIPTPRYGLDFPFIRFRGIGVSPIRISGVSPAPLNP